MCNSMIVTKKSVVVGIIFVVVVFFTYQKWASQEASTKPELYIPTQSQNVNIVYKTPPHHINPFTHSRVIVNKGTDHDNTQGYLLALRIMEQQTSGAKNVLQLGCLAASMGLRAVEPYAKDSFFFYPLTAGEVNLEQTFSDYFSSVSVKANYKHASFDRWDAFLNRAPKRIVFVHLSYESIPSSSKATEVPVDNCHITSNLQDFITKHGFVLVRCIDYAFTDETGSNVKLTDPTTFSKTIFGPYQPSQVNVMFGKWKGLGTRTRIPLNTQCRNIYGRHLMPSETMVADGNKYIHTYLQDSNYIAIMLRTEKVIFHSDGKNDADFSKELAVCYQEVRDTVAKIRKASSEEQKIFMTVDLGVFGTKGDPERKTGKKASVDSPVYLTTIQFMKEMYANPHWSLAEWEQTFLNAVGNKTDTGYIAGLQRTVASKSNYLIVMGGGSFQVLALDLYENFHPARKQDGLFKVCWT